MCGKFLPGQEILLTSIIYSVILNQFYTIGISIGVAYSGIGSSASSIILRSEASTVNQAFHYITMSLKACKGTGSLWFSFFIELLVQEQY
jgi:predicted PP-loop superfamily ATPase